MTVFKLREYDKITTPAIATANAKFKQRATFYQVNYNISFTANE